MDSSLAIFSTLGSPFLETSSSQSHYHPSQAQPLRQDQRSTVLSPSRLQHKNCATSPKKAETLSPPHLSFLPDIGYQQAKPSNSDSTSPFNESWPSTERSSTSLTPEEGKALPTMGAKVLSPLKPQEPVSDSESVIARYIERFRYGEPTNRKERRAPSDSSSWFWWLGHSFVSEGNISKKESSPSSDSSQSGVRASLFHHTLDQSPLGDLRDTSTLDLETVSLQERAARLLQRSTSPSGDSRHVNAEGRGSTLTSIITNADVDLAGHTPWPLTAHQGNGSLTAVPYHFTQRSQSCFSIKPEEDILFQWRLQRKMEEASKAAAVMPSIAWRSQCGQRPSAFSVVERATLKSPEPTRWRSKGRMVWPTSEAHLGMRSTLDEDHICCCTNPVRKEPSFGQLTETASFRNEIVEGPGLNGEQGLKKLSPQEATVPAHVDWSPRPEPITNGEQGVKEPTPQKDCIAACLESSSPWRPAGTRKHLNHTVSHHGQRAAEPDKRVQIEPKGNQRPYGSKRGQPKSVTDSREPPISPTKQLVQCVLGEVVAERLFSPPESPALHRDKPKRSKDWDPKKAMPDPVAVPSHPQLLDMAAQLLEQAEDSDGTEFEDDPLLQVLRGQREVLRSQLRAVDIQMAQLEGHHSEQDFS